MQAMVITGMHRSGTSLVASLFNKAGVQLGSTLIAPRENDNPRGFFEDAEFVEFHQALLHARGQEILVARDFILQPDASETARARALISARANQPLWGWKDPRTCLVLDFWDALLSDARYVLVYRHPFDVTLSLARREQVVGFDLYAGLEAWYAYNRALLQFARAHPARVVLCSSYAIVEHIEIFNDALEKKLNLRLSLDAALRDEIFSDELLRRPAHTRATENILRLIHPEAMQLYDELQTRADLPCQEILADASDAQNALLQFAQTLVPAPAPGQCRALAHMLVAVTQPDLYERISRAHIQQTIKLDVQRRAWQETARAREIALREQSDWALPRLKYLETLEANRAVRALVRLGILPRG